MKSARSIKRRLRNIEAAAAQSAGKKNVPRRALVATATIPREDQKIVGMLRDLGLTRLQLIVIGESLRQSAAAKKN